MATRTPIERFMEKVQVSESLDDACAVWTAAKGDNGYGQFRFEGATVSAHRWIYEYLVGPIPSGLELDHLCRNRACVNVGHLEPVTHGENERRKPEDVKRANIAKAISASAAKRRARTHCKHGHEFTPENTRIQARGKRVCRQCAREAGIRHRAKVNATT